MLATRVFGSEFDFWDMMFWASPLKIFQEIALNECVVSLQTN